MVSDNEILNYLISDLPLNNEIREICMQHGIKNLKDLLEISDYNMIHRMGFSYHAVMELFGYLQSNGLGDLMESSGEIKPK